MRKFFLLLCCLSLFSCSAKPILHDTEGHTISLNNTKGKWMILHYWALWCPSCMHEIPLLNLFYKENLPKNSVLYGVNYDQLNGNALKQAMQKAHIAFPVLIENPNLLFQIGDIGAIPLTIIIDPHGKIIKKIQGPLNASSLLEMNSLIKNHENSN